MFSSFGCVAKITCNHNVTCFLKFNKTPFLAEIFCNLGDANNTTCEIERLHRKLKELGRDHRTVKNVIISPAQCNERSDEGKIRKEALVSHRAMRQIKKQVRRSPLQTSKELFESAGVPDVPNQLDAVS